MTKEQYARAVERCLRDLPWRLRRDLVADLRTHLDEVPDDHLETRLGPAMLYAAELRNAAGLDSRRGVVAFLRARHPSNLALALGAVAVVGLFIVAVMWAKRYQPIVGGNYGVNPIAFRTDALGETVTPFRPGAPFRFGFSVKNEGRFTVRILDVPAARDWFGLFRARAYVAPVNLPRGDVGRNARFRPFDLHPGDQAVITLRGHYVNCRKRASEDDGSALTTFQSFDVLVGFLWWKHRAPVELIEPLVLEAKGTNMCAA